MNEEWLETLNLMGKGYISQEDYYEIFFSYIRCSQGISCARGSKPYSGGITLMEISNLLEDFKKNILGTLTMQLDVLQAKQKQALV